MGIFTSCCKPSASESNVITPDVETRRRQQVEAAEKRKAEQESRGIKEKERLKERLDREEETARRYEELAKAGGPTLKWTTN